MVWEESRQDEAIQTGPGLWTSRPSSTAILITIILIVAVVVSRNKTLSFYLKYHAFNGIYFFFGIICIPIMLFNACNPKSTRLPRLLVRRVQAPLFGIRVKVQGMDNYPKGPFVVVCNHQSSLDCIGIVDILPENGVIIMKKTLKYMGPFGLSAILAGTIFIDRRNKSSTQEILQDAVGIMQRKQYQVFIFPEGTRKLTTDKGVAEPMLPFKKGAFNLAVLAQVPVVPVVFSSQKHLIDFKEHTFVSGEYTATVLPPVSTDGLTLDDVPDLSDQIRAQMIECFLNHVKSDKTKGS